jgi:hypothetical protein
MGKKATVLSLVLCVLLFALADRSFSQARGPRTPAEHQQWVQEQQRKAEQNRLENEEKRKAAEKDAHKIVDEYSDEAWQEALGATPEQWKTIKPRLEKVKKVEYPPVIHLSVYGFGGGGTSTSSSFSRAGGTGTGGSASGGAGGFAGGTSSGGFRSSYSGRASGNAGFAGGGSGGASGGQGGSFSSAGGASSGGGYGFAIGGSGPVKKKVGEVSLGWQWSRPSLNKSPNQLSENEKTCEQLLDVLEKDKPNPEQVRQRLEALRRIREQIQAERREARRQLREVVTPEQEAKLILMGYLE